MLGPDHHPRAVEIGEPTGPHIYCADADAHLFRVVDAVEIDKLFKRVPSALSVL